MQNFTKIDFTTKSLEFALALLLELLKVSLLCDGAIKGYVFAVTLK